MGAHAEPPVTRLVPAPPSLALPPMPLAKGAISVCQLRCQTDNGSDAGLPGACKLPENRQEHAKWAANMLE